MAGVQLQQPSMTDYRLPMHQAPPSRKPVPGMHSGYPLQSYEGPHHQQLSPHPSAASLAHIRRRTSSSHVLPYMAQQQQQPYSGGPSPHHTMTMTGPNYPPSRRLSSATTSTTSTGNVANPYYGAAPNADIRRSTSSRSANAQLGYVALMRRQKATVWCDRAQPEDPRLRAQKLVDKKRAYLEVHGAGAGRSGTLGSGKNKHSGKTTDFSPSTLVGATVPVRLSANEVGDADEDAHSERGFPYRRTGSGRSSVGSISRYPSGYQRTPQGTMGSNSTPPNEKTDLPDVSEHPPAESLESEQYEASIKDTATSYSRGSEENLDVVGDMAAPSAASAAIQKAKKADELRRRGSVDERTTSMTNVRLFVANPDLSD
ncbi:hypothetical protein BO70DRAFT_50792 [Aspergillus heteromorphus CBS 117.55]|uniref:Uncharacterized protein n=1 Tax=Aspergillus heteromorphus CBS 117.55 TaxID=1448321 RepID=A0A317W0Q7_9EURO|nr:uncharacterized protein BO70DRAFT_50792 [Aspergillus heteromorphus CBS 117.55]PWY79575.1 hypothetical protein BO70DRAFT_50792 [Aspergillus heteromorphus CBS 117.55]